jgi:hypothetical protein
MDQAIAILDPEVLDVAPHPKRYNTPVNGYWDLLNILLA